MANAADHTKYVSLERTREFLKLSEDELKHEISVGNLRAYRDDDLMKFRLDDVRQYRTGKKGKKKKEGSKKEKKVDKNKQINKTNKSLKTIEAEPDRNKRTNKSLKVATEEKEIPPIKLEKKARNEKTQDSLKKVEETRPSRTNDQLSALDLEEPEDLDKENDDEIEEIDEVDDYEVDEELKQFLQSTEGEELGSYAESKAFIPRPPNRPVVEEIPDEKSPQKEKFMILGGLLVIVALIIFVNFKSKVFFQEEQRLAVQVGEMKQGDITVIISATGEVHPINLANIYAKISGSIETITVQEGQKVTKDQPLAYLVLEELEQEIDRAKNQLAEARSRYEGAEIALENAKQDFEREKEKLKNEDINLANQIAQAESDLRTIDYNIKKTENELGQSRKELENEEVLLRQGFGKQQDVESAQQRLEDVKTRLKVKLEEYNKAKIHCEELRNKLGQSGDTKLNSVLNNLKAKENQLETEKIRVEKAESDLKSKEEKQALKVLRSPIAGVVSKIDVSPGDIVTQGSRGAEPLFVVFDESAMEIHSSVDEIDIHSIKKNQEVLIEIEAIPGAEFRGHVSSVATTASKTQKGSGTSFAVKIKVGQGAERMKPGLSATVGILTQNRKDILKAPQQAVMTKTESELTGKFNFNTEEKAEEIYKVIFVVENRKAIAKRVKTGISDDTYVEIMEGVSLEDTIIIGPYRTLDKLKDGDLVVLTTDTSSN